MRIYLVTALLSLTLLYQVWGVPKTYLAETKDHHEDAANEFGDQNLRKFEDSIGSCNWSHDCKSYFSCKHIFDAHCVCKFGQCVVQGLPFMGIGWSECKQYTDCDCRKTPETCFCQHGSCEETRWECHEKRDCARLSKCWDRNCTCSGNLCEHQCDTVEDCKDFSCNTSVGYTCKCEDSLCAYKKKPKECRTIEDCVHQGLCQADTPCACTNEYCTLPWWMKDKNSKNNCRNHKDCEEIILDCAGGKCSCLDMVRTNDWNLIMNKGTCVPTKIPKWLKNPKWLKLKD